MQKATRKSKTTREAVLAELAQLAEGRHPECKSITGRFVRCPELQHASKILSDAIHAASNRHPAGRGEISPPPGWLLPV
jgi:hypothetical protein